MTPKNTLQVVESDVLAQVLGGNASGEAFPAEQHRTWADSYRDRQQRIQEGYPAARPGYGRPINIPGPGNNTI